MPPGRASNAVVWGDRAVVATADAFWLLSNSAAGSIGPYRLKVPAPANKDPPACMNKRRVIVIVILSTGYPGSAWL